MFFFSPQVRDDYGKLRHLIDGRDALHSNWLRYVNCSAGVNEQNIRAVQYDGNVYFMATKKIEIGDELLTFYGKKFARKLGITLSEETADNQGNNNFDSRVWNGWLLQLLGINGWQSGSPRIPPGLNPIALRDPVQQCLPRWDK